MATLNLDKNSGSLSTDIQRLSTGLQINSASDNPSGLVISQNMSAQLVGIQQATSNSNDAINETKTAEIALAEVQSLLQSMRQIAVGASNLGVNDSTDIAADQAQITSAIQSINRISATTQFGTKNLLDGSATSASTTTAGSSAIAGTGLTAISGGRWTAANAFAYNTNTVTAATATVANATASATLVGQTFGGTLGIDGVNYNIAAASSLANLNTAIAASGYTATIAGTTFTLTSTATGAPAAAQSFTTTGLTANGGVITVAAAAAVQGTNASLTLNDGAGHTLNSVNTVSNGSAGNTFTFSNGLVVSSATLNGAIAATTLTGTSGTSTTGNSLQYQIGANDGQTVALNIQSTAADQLGQGAANYTDANGVSQTVYTDSVQNLNVSTFKGAQDAIAVIDQANNQISTLRAQLGAFQTNILQANATSLGVAQQNLDSSKSTITDADLAATVVQYTKDQILVQSATSALSYANQMPQSLLKLLQ